MKQKIRIGLYVLMILIMLLSGCNLGAVLSGNVPTTDTAAPGFTTTAPRPTTILPLGTTQSTVNTTVTTKLPVTTIPTAPTTVPTAPTTIPTAPTTVPTAPTTIPTAPTTIPTEPPAPEYHLHIQLRGAEEVTLEYGNDFSDPGVHAWLTVGDSLTIEQEITDVAIEGQVDCQTLGSYALIYTVTYDNMQESIRRIIHIVDTQAPVITLLSDPDHYTYPGHSYEEEGFKAMDGYDGDITDRVVRTEENGVVTYRVTDASGNETVTERVIRYDDPVPPTLSLRGKENITIKQGQPYNDPGVSASDECDGNLNAAVQIEGSVNIYIPGEYVITYTVQDAAGNQATAQRRVVVEKFAVDKVIYLTFDDGPSYYTPRLLEVLAKYNVKATFFVVWTVNGFYEEYIDDIVAQGHSIGVHSKTHEFGKIYASEEAFFEDFDFMRNVIYQRTGVLTNLMRFPGGSSNTASRYNPGIMTRLTKLVKEKGYYYWDWNVESGDAGRVYTADEVLANVIQGCKGRKVSYVLQHDSLGYSVDAVERIIQWGLENGYTFLPIDETTPEYHHPVYN